jgi:hypothetical protein
MKKTEKRPVLKLDKTAENAFIAGLEARGEVFYGKGPLPRGATHRGHIDPATKEKTVTRERMH